MTKATAGFRGSLDVSEADGVPAYVNVGGVSNVDFSNTMAELIAAAIGDEENSRIYGLEDATMTVATRFRGGDAGQNLVKTERKARRNVRVRYLPDAAVGDGWSALFIVTTVQVTQAVDGLVEQTFNFALAEGPITVESA